MRFAILIGASVCISGCSTIGSFSDLKNKIVPDKRPVYSAAHQESAAKDITRNIPLDMPEGKSLAFIKNKSSSYEPAMTALENRGFSVLLVKKKKDVSSGQLPVRYTLDGVSDESQLAIAEIKVSDDFRVSRVYKDTGVSLVPASPVTMSKGKWDE